MYELPTTVLVNGEEYNIRNKGDYRLVLDCFFTLENEELTKQERLLACLVIFYECFDDIDDLFELDNKEDFVQPMYRFLNCGRTEEELGRKSTHKLIDWKRDELLIISAINTVANKEIRSEKYMHWWTFMSYYMGIGECTLSYIIRLREKKAKHEKLEKHERKFIQENPQYFTWDNRLIDQKEADKIAFELWNNGD